MAKGFVINGFNPMVLFFRIGTMGVATALGYNSPAMAAIFFGSIVATVFVTDVIKAKLSDKLRVILTARTMKIMNLLVGVLMFVFGLMLRLVMLAAIQFNDQFLAWSAEIDNIVADGMLPSKMDISSAMPAQMYPELFFGGR